MEIHIDNNLVSQLIQLSLVPVFLLVGIGQMLNVMTGRLARIIDRARWYEECHNQGIIEQFNETHIAELDALRRRMRFSNFAINFVTAAAIIVCLTVILLLFNGILSTSLDNIILGLFILGMLAITGGMLSFFMEVSIASRTLKIPNP